jgi:hypothetical protein
MISLHFAACCARFDMLEVLLVHGAFINAQDGRRHPPFHAENDYGDTRGFLISCGCDNRDGRKGAEIVPKPLKKELIDFIIAALTQRARAIQLSSSNAGIYAYCQKEKAEFVSKQCQHVFLCGCCDTPNKDAHNRRENPARPAS